MFERFTDRARRVLVLAQEESRLLGHDHIGTEDILLGLVGEGDGVAAMALDRLGVSLVGARAKVRELSPAGESVPLASQPFTRKAKEVLELSLREALELGHNYIGTEHMLLGLVAEGADVGFQVLRALDVEAGAVREEVLLLLSGEFRAAHAAVVADVVERTDVPFPAGSVLTPDEANEFIRGWLVVESDVERAVLEDVDYETATHTAAMPPRISLTVLGAKVTPESFDRSSVQIGDAETVDGVGDAAAYSPRRRSLRVLSGTTVLVVRVDHHPDPKGAAAAVASRAVANLTGRDERGEAL